MQAVIFQNVTLVQCLINANLEKHLAKGNEKEIGETHQPKKCCYQSHEINFWKDTEEV